MSKECVRRCLTAFAGKGSERARFSYQHFCLFEIDGVPGLHATDGKRMAILCETPLTCESKITPLRFYEPKVIEEFAKENQRFYGIEQLASRARGNLTLAETKEVNYPDFALAIPNGEERQSCVISPLSFDTVIKFLKALYPHVTDSVEVSLSRDRIEITLWRGGGKGSVAFYLQDSINTTETIMFRVNPLYFAQLLSAVHDFGFTQIEYHLVLQVITAQAKGYQHVLMCQEKS